MANSSLRTNIQANDTGNLADRNTVHSEVNELSRDTGVRDVTSLLINGWTASSVKIERIRDRVYLYIRGLNGASATSTRFMDFSGGLGSSFSPADATESPALRTGSTYDARVTASLTGGLSCPTGVDLGTASTREISWRCTASWPSTLPGAAA